MNMALGLQARMKELEMMCATKCGFEKRPLRRSTASVALVVSALLAAASVKPCLAGPSQTGFPSPDDASRALVSAAQEHDERAVIKILGGASGLIRSDDEAVDALERDRFVQKYQEMHRWVRQSGIATLYIGAENWPFPIPLVSRNGEWRFDSKAGSDEILFRRIGENEVTAILICDTLITPETHAESDSEATRFIQTLHSGAGKPSPFRGYNFHVLTNSGGGIAVVAYPAVYRHSGVMTFIATQEGGVSEKDLGPGTAKIAGAMTTYRADATWTPVESTP